MKKDERSAIGLIWMIFGYLSNSFDDRKMEVFYEMNQIVTPNSFSRKLRFYYEVWTFLSKRLGFYVKIENFLSAMGFLCENRTCSQRKGDFMFKFGIFPKKYWFYMDGRSISNNLLITVAKQQLKHQTDSEFIVFLHYGELQSEENSHKKNSKKESVS